MTIGISFDRSKLDTTNSFVEDVNFKTPTITSNVIEVPIVIETLAIDAGSATILGTYGTGSDLIDAAPGTFTNDVVRLGDVVQTSPSGDIPGATTVIAINSDAQIQISANPSAANGDTTLNITPPTVDATIGIMEIAVSIGGSILSLTPKVYLYDGTAVADPTGAAYDQATTAEASSNTPYAASTFNLDSYLTAARVSRTN